MPKILIYDLHACIREMYRNEFQDDGYDVLIVSSLRDALKAFRNEAPAIVLFSIERIGAELLGTIEQILSASRRTPLIFAESAASASDSECAGLSTLDHGIGSDLAAIKKAVRDLCSFSVNGSNQARVNNST